MKKLLLLLFIGIFLISFISADVSIGSVKQGDTIQLTQICSNCSYVNLTSVLYPNNTYALLGQYAMTKNGTNYNYTWTDTNLLGNYVYTTCGDLNGVNTCQSVAFTVTPSGQSGTDNIVFFIFVVLLLYGITFTGFFGKNIPITIFGGMAMMFLGVYMVNQGVIIFRDNLTNYIAYLTISIGALLSLWAGYELYQDM